ncbi:MAG: response regulator transcription factor [Chloroflexaceae bacterium]|nr:response regulator transcription factor [Chloroflexaceae bacterium]NJL34903.1 response regulator transcription factor [Chloroflexaceae bacterium]NJO04866.1 response regulator transcription factor [Chloroflexaceae bacterium]NJO85215.1 response regulator transcription factor [Blastochloris sp.]
MAVNAAVELLLVDDHPLFRQGVQYALSAESDIIVVGEAASGEDALQWLDTISASQEPNVVLIDLNLPGMNGLDLTRQLRRQYPGIKVVILSVHENDAQAFQALKSGAAAYCSKDIKPRDLAQILRRVAQGEYVINDMIWEDPKVAGRVLSMFRNLPEELTSMPDAEMLFPPPSERELQVLERIAAGGSNKEIADELGISTQTVKNHISSILRKLALSDRTQAVLYALRRGWIEPPDEIRMTSDKRTDDDTDAE